VLHVLPADATLSCGGLEEWIDAGRGFEPLIAMREPSPRFTGYPRVEFPAPPERWDRLARLFLRRGMQGNGWPALLEAHGVAVVHLHDLAGTEDLIAAARFLEVPVVVSWPRGADPEGFRFEGVDRVLVPSPAVGERLQAAGYESARIRVAPIPLKPLPTRAYKIQRGEPVRWVTATTLGDEAGWRLTLEAFAKYRVEQPGASLKVLTASALPEAFEGLVRSLGLEDAVEAVTAMSVEAARIVLRAAHVGVFPVLPASAADRGLDGPAWMAASAGLPLVLGREAGVDGFFDHQGALLAEPTAEALAKRMVILACRPYIWEPLGRQARLDALSRLNFDRARQIPLEVYRSLLAAQVEDMPQTPTRRSLLSRVPLPRGTSGR
jgi:hypothetical protein